MVTHHNQKCGLGALKLGLVGALAVCCLAGAGENSSPAEAEQRGAILSVTDENDAWSNPFGPHQDRHYTHGVKLAFVGSDTSMTNLTGWFNRLFAWGRQPLPGNFGFVAGQNMYTPENILDPKPIYNDRPYAGWLYGGLVYQRRHERSAHFATLESFELDLGIVGPDSEADDTQTFIHEWRFPEDIPQGWGNQLHDEPGLLLKYAHLWRYSPSDKTARYVDLLPRAGFELGNVAVFATAGAAARLGWNLPPDFGAQIIDSPASVNGGMNGNTPWLAAYLFAAWDGRYVARDITLDGNTFRSSQSVDKYHFVNDVTWGFAFDLFRHLELSYAHVTRSKQFVGQVHQDAFGSINLKWRFSF